LSAARCERGVLAEPQAAGLGFDDGLMVNDGRIAASEKQPVRRDVEGLAKAHDHSDGGLIAVANAADGFVRNAQKTANLRVGAGSDDFDDAMAEPIGECFCADGSSRGFWAWHDHGSPTGIRFRIGLCGRWRLRQRGKDDVGGDRDHNGHDVVSDIG